MCVSKCVCASVSVHVCVCVEYVTVGTNSTNHPMILETSVVFVWEALRLEGLSLFYG